jgi:hypothetical protein
VDDRVAIDVLDAEHDGSIRRECIDHVVMFGERHLRHVLLSYMNYYNRASEHPSVYVVEEKRLC